MQFDVYLNVSTVHKFCWRLRYLHVSNAVRRRHMLERVQATCLYWFLQCSIGIVDLSSRYWQLSYNTMCTVSLPREPRKLSRQYHCQLNSATKKKNQSFCGLRDAAREWAHVGMYATILSRKLWQTAAVNRHLWRIVPCTAYSSCCSLPITYSELSPVFGCGIPIGRAAVESSTGISSRSVTNILLQNFCILPRQASAQLDDVP